MRFLIVESYDDQSGSDFAWETYAATAEDALYNQVTPGATYSPVFLRQGDKWEPFYWFLPYSQETEAHA